MQITEEVINNIKLGLVSLSINAWSITEEKGFHDIGRSQVEDIALMHSELSEALEEIREGTPSLYYRRPDGTTTDDFVTNGEYNKPEGKAAELADVLIRVLDSAAEHNDPIALATIQKLQYNNTRPHLHGKKL